MDGNKIVIRNVAWAAGLFEGEGSAGIHWSRPRSNGIRSGSPQINIGMTDLEPLQWFKAAVVGGQIAGPYQKRPGNKPIWTWAAEGKEARRIAALMRPYLSPRRETQFVNTFDVVICGDGVGTGNGNRFGLDFEVKHFGHRINRRPVQKRCLDCDGAQRRRREERC